VNLSKAVVKRILELCKERGITVNALSNISGVTQSTVNDIVNGTTRNPGIVTIKKLCDGFEITLTEFFNSPLFAHLDQEIK
jgi:transcriptional regulator with XRE-family HTH domain